MAVKPPECVEEIKVAVNPYVELFMDRVRFGNGREGTHARVVERPGGAAILVVDHHRRIYLHQAFHYAAGRYFTEIIRGFGEDRESAAQTAERELAEEAGFEYVVREEPTRIGTVFPNSTLLSAGVAVFLIRAQVGRPRAPTDVEESIAGGDFFAVDEVMGMVGRGEIVDGFTLSALALAWSRGLLAPSSYPEDGQQKEP